MNLSQPVLTFRRERLVPGGQQVLVAEVVETLPAGARLLLAQLHRGERQGPQFVAHRIAPASPTPLPPSPSTQRTA